MAKSKVISFRLPLEIHSSLSDEAAEANQNLSDLIIDKLFTVVNTEAVNTPISLPPIKVIEQDENCWSLLKEYL